MWNDHPRGARARDSGRVDEQLHHPMHADVNTCVAVSPETARLRHVAATVTAQAPIAGELPASSTRSMSPQPRPSRRLACAMRHANAISSPKRSHRWLKAAATCAAYKPNPPPSLRSRHTHDADRDARASDGAAILRSPRAMHVTMQLNVVINQGDES